MSTTINMRHSKLIINDAVLLAELHTPKGGLWKALHKAGDLAVAGAKAQVGKKTGKLAQSIHMRHTPTLTGQQLWIGSDNKLALIQHQGTRPHMIFPHEGPKNGVLIFAKGSRVIATRMVRHPGTKPNKYLSTQLRVFKPLMRGA